MPLMARMGENSGEKTQVELHPKGWTQGVCVECKDLGIVPVTWQGQTKKRHKVQYIFQSPALTSEGNRFLLYSARFGTNLVPEKFLAKFLSDWTGETLTEERLKEGIDLTSYVGLNAFMNITHRQGQDGRLWSNISSIGPLPAGTPPMKADGYSPRPPAGSLLKPAPSPPAPPLDAEDDDDPALRDVPF